MGPLRDIHLSRWGAVLLAAVSLAATIFILAGGSAKSDARLAAEAALRHPLTRVDEVQAPTSTAAASSGSASAAASVSPPASDSGSSNPSASATSSGASSSSGGGGDTSSGAGGTSTSSQATTTATTTTPAPDAGLPKVGHVFLVTLSTPDYRDAFGARSPAPYLRTLARRGTVLTGYHALGKNGLADLLAIVSGQAPNRDTSAGCRTYSAFPESAKVTTAGIAKGTGCVYPDGALTVADEATAAGKSWGAYVADMGDSNCAVPESGTRLDTPIDGTQEGYDVAHNPFAFFGSLLDAGGCSEYDQDLSNLPAALAKPAKTPNLTYLSGDACVDADPTLAPATTTTSTTSATGTTTTTSATTPGATTAGAAATYTAAGTTTPATTTTAATTTATTTTATSTVPARLIPPAGYGCPSGEPSGLAGEDAFLKTWIPKLLTSAAYKANGVIVIAFTGANGKAHADTGALVISRWTPKGKRLKTAYDAYSLLHSIQDMLNLAPLARSAGAPAFAKLVLR